MLQLWKCRILCTLITIGLSPFSRFGGIFSHGCDAHLSTYQLHESHHFARYGIACNECNYVPRKCEAELRTCPRCHVDFPRAEPPGDRRRPSWTPSVASETATPHTPLTPNSPLNQSFSFGLATGNGSPAHESGTTTPVPMQRTESNGSSGVAGALTPQQSLEQGTEEQKPSPDNDAMSVDTPMVCTP